VATLMVDTFDYQVAARPLGTLVDAIFLERYCAALTDSRDLPETGSRDIDQIEQESVKAAEFDSSGPRCASPVRSTCSFADP